MTRVLNIKGGGIAPNCPPSGAVYIGRATRNGWRASRWANPFKVGRDGTLPEVLAKYRRYVCDSPDLMAALPELQGKVLLCWCAPNPCHGDVLLDLLALRTGGRRA
jgi:hypothetical protein